MLFNGLLNKAIIFRYVFMFVEHVGTDLVEHPVIFSRKFWVKNDYSNYTR